MATKPDPVNDLPPAWGGAGLYVGGVYGPFLPWGAVNLLSGQPLPWTAQPRLNSTGLAAFAEAGLTPQEPNDASVFNEWLRRVQVWAEWVSAGSSEPDPDAHVVESRAGGAVSAMVFEAASGYANAGGLPAFMTFGVVVPDTTNLTLAGNAEIAGVVTTVARVGIIELHADGAPTANRQIHHMGGEPRWNDGDDDYIHHGTEPWGPVASAPPLANFGPTSVEIDGPSVSVTLTGTAFVRVTASGALLGTAGDTVAGVRVEVDGADIYDETFEVFNTDRPLSWSVSFASQEGAGTFDVKIKFRRSAGSGSVNLDASSIFAMPY